MPLILRFALQLAQPRRRDETPLGNQALTIRRTIKNGKGRYVTADQVALFGLAWGFGSFPKTRDDLAREIGKVILDEAGI